MPKVILGTQAKLEDKEEREMAKLSELVRTCKGRTMQKDKDTAQTAGVSIGIFCKAKHPENVYGMSLRVVRRIAHAVGCTKEDWLKIGGFQ